MKSNLKPGDLVRWTNRTMSTYFGKTAEVASITNGDPKTLVVKQTTEMARCGLGAAWGSALGCWEPVLKSNPRNEWGEEGL